MMNKKYEQISIDSERDSSFYDESVIGKKKMPPFMYVLAVVSVIIVASYVVFAATGNLCFEKPETDGKGESYSHETVKQITTINHKGSVWEKETTSSEAESTLSDREHTVVRNNYGSYSSGNNSGGNNSGGSTSGESIANTPTGNTEKPAENNTDNPTDKSSTKETEKSEETSKEEKSSTTKRSPLADILKK